MTEIKGYIEIQYAVDDIETDEFDVGYNPPDTQDLLLAGVPVGEALDK